MAIFLFRFSISAFSSPPPPSNVGPPSPAPNAAAADSPLRKTIHPVRPRTQHFTISAFQRFSVSAFQHFPSPLHGCSALPHSPPAGQASRRNGIPAVQPVTPGAAVPSRLVPSRQGCRGSLGHCRRRSLCEGGSCPPADETAHAKPSTSAQAPSEARHFPDAPPHPGLAIATPVG